MATVPASARITRLTVAVASAGPFSVGFRLFDDDALRVYVDDEETTDYTLSATYVDGYTDTATITLDSAVTGSVVIEGEMPGTREDDYLPSDPGLVRKLNAELGRAWAAISDIRARLRRAPKIPPSNSLIDPVLPSPVSGAILVGRSDGAGWENGASVADIIGGSGSADGVYWRDTCAAVLADAVFAYAAGTGLTVVTAGAYVRTRDGHGYQVAASGASDHHATTAGGVKLYALPSQDGAFSAALWGFQTGASAATNDTAITTAITVAAGRKVIVPAASDFLANNVGVTGDLDLAFVGPGRWDITAGHTALTVTHGYDAALAITGFFSTTLSVEGQTCDVTRISVASSATFSKGDVVKIFSNDEDPKGETTVTTAKRRRGEFAVVSAVATGFIYVPRLASASLYTTAPRIARMKKFDCNISGLRIKSNTSHATAAVVLTGCYRPKVEILEVETHGQICLNSLGSYQGEFHVKGDGFTDDTPSTVLGYLVNDANGQDNRFWLHGRFWRHVYTSNFAAVEADTDAPQSYGRCRRPWVTGIADQCWGVPWDTHPGCEEPTFTDCVAMDLLNGFSGTSAYSFESIGGSVVNCYGDATFNAFFRLVGNAVGAEGTFRVINPHSECKQAYIGPNASAGNCEVQWTGGRVKVEDVPSLTPYLFDVQNSRLRLGGGAALRIDDLDVEFGRIFELTDASVVAMDGTPLISIAGTGTSTRIVNHTSGTTLFTGGFRLRHSGVTWTALVRREAGTARAFWRASIESGGIVTASLGTFDANKYCVNVPGNHGTSDTNITTVDDLAKSLGSF